MRKLDALVERYIFELEERPHKYSKACTEWYDPKIADYDDSYVSTHPRKYGSEIDITWKIVEKLQEMGRILMLSYHPVNKKWCADFELWKDGGEYLDQLRYAHASSAPAAIRLAALRAVGVPESEIQAAIEAEEAHAKEVAQDRERYLADSKEEDIARIEPTDRRYWR